MSRMFLTMAPPPGANIPALGETSDEACTTITNAVRLSTLLLKFRSQTVHRFSFSLLVQQIFHRVLSLQFRAHLVTMAQEKSDNSGMQIKR